MIQRAEVPVQLAGVEASRRFFAPSLAGLGRDVLLVAHLDEQARCTHLSAYPAASDHGEAPIRDILLEARRLSSAGVMLAQKQAITGGAMPDRGSTRSLARAAEAIDVTVVDHLLFTGERCTSMRRMGLL